MTPATLGTIPAFLESECVTRLPVKCDTLPEPPLKRQVRGGGKLPLPNETHECCWVFPRGPRVLNRVGDHPTEVAPKKQTSLWLANYY